MKLHIQGGRLIDPASALDGLHDVFIAQGRVVGIAQAPEGFVADRTIDAQGLIVCPGLVDVSARLREPGYEYKATLESEIHAAVAGGITSLACPPDTDPALDEPGLVEMLKFRAAKLNQTQVFPLGALTQGLKGTALTEMAELTEAGCVGFSQADASLIDTQVLMRAMQYARTFGYTLWLRPQDPWLSKGGVAGSGALASRLGLPSIPASAEVLALHTIFELMRVSGVKVHLCRLSSRAGLELVRAAKEEGLPVTADVNVHHLHLADVDIGYFNSQMRFQPPLRSVRDRDALRAALLDGTLDIICSDHTPVDEDEKLLPFSEATPGATGLELLLPLTLKWAAEMKLSLIEALTFITCRPAALLENNEAKAMGCLVLGGQADLCLFDPEAIWTVTADVLRSQGKNSPFLGYEMQGQVKYTIINGQIVFKK